MRDSGDTSLTSMLPPAPRAEDQGAPPVEKRTGAESAAALNEKLLSTMEAVLAETKALRSEVSAAQLRLKDGDALFGENDKWFGLLFNSLRAILESKGLTEDARKLDPEIERLGIRGKPPEAVHELPTSPSNSKPPPQYDAE